METRKTSLPRRSPSASWIFSRLRFIGGHTLVQGLKKAVMMTTLSFRTSGEKGGFLPSWLISSTSEKYFAAADGAGCWAIATGPKKNRKPIVARVAFRQDFQDWTRCILEIQIGRAHV